MLIISPDILQLDSLCAAMVTLEKKLDDKVNPRDAFSEAVKVSTAQPVRVTTEIKFLLIVLIRCHRFHPWRAFPSLSDETLSCCPVSI